MTAVSPVEWNECPSACRRVAELGVVEDLAVEDDDVPGRRIDHRLRAGGGEVEDREPPVSEQRAEPPCVRRGLPRASGVGPAVKHGVAHPLECAAVAIVDAAEDASDATHGSGRVTDHGCRSESRPTARMGFDTAREYR